MHDRFTRPLHTRFLKLAIDVSVITGVGVNHRRILRSLKHRHQARLQASMYVSSNMTGSTQTETHLNSLMKLEYSAAACPMDTGEIRTLDRANTL